MCVEKGGKRKGPLGLGVVWLWVSQKLSVSIKKITDRVKIGTQLFRTRELVRGRKRLEVPWGFLQGGKGGE